MMILMCVIGGHHDGQRYRSQRQCSPLKNHQKATQLGTGLAVRSATEWISFPPARYVLYLYLM